MAERYEVALTQTSEGWGYCDTKTLPCGFMSKDQITKYLNELAQKEEIPEESCLYDVSARFHAYQSHDVSLVRNRTNETISREKDSGGLYIQIRRVNCSKCPYQDCFENIQNGKCIDPFAIDIIGKKFFAKKYIDEKTQQK